MAWRPPKTNWAVQPQGENGEYMGDFLHPSDYTRIKENLEYLGSEIGVPLIGMDAQAFGMYGPNEKHLNAIESNIERLFTSWHRPPGVQNTKTWSYNTPFPVVDDWNRWEKSILEIYAAYGRTIKRKLPVVLGLGGRL